MTGDINMTQLANAIRILSMDAVEAARSGHPGMPMGMADIAQVLWCDVLNHAPQDPLWLNRDRFVLSNGHGSMLLYAALYLRGYPLTLDDLKAFRQMGSLTPGHPEYAPAYGIETTTGPLGQGFANAVGMALAERMFAKRFNRPDFELIDHWTYVMLGDGCLMEGISHEVASLAGYWGLGRLVAIWDDNGISIDGPVSGWSQDDTVKRFESYGWQVIQDIDGHDPDAIRSAFAQARAHTDQPTLLCCQTQIGYGSPAYAGTAKVHGAPLGPDEVQAARKALQWPSAIPFEIPDECLSAWRAANPSGDRYDQWQSLWKTYQAEYPELAQDLKQVIDGALPDRFESIAQTVIDQSIESAPCEATRQSSGKIIQSYAPYLPEWIGGSADLTESNCTAMPQAQVVGPHTVGQYIHFGVREFGMFAIMNGLALYGGFRPFGGTFLTFSDYGRNAIRLAAMMSLPVTFVLTHDSVALGEDGPTHQPIEQIASLRAMPGLSVWRPCDAVETSVAWASILKAAQPSALLLTRQSLPTLPEANTRAQGCSKGGYIAYEPHFDAEVIIIATGSEVLLAHEAALHFESKGIGVRVVSMPCVELFLEQPIEWQNSVLPPTLQQRVAVEAGVAQPWYRFVGLKGSVVSIEGYGHSAPAQMVLEACQITTQAVIDAVKIQLNRSQTNQE